MKKKQFSPVSDVQVWRHTVSAGGAGRRRPFVLSDAPDQWSTDRQEENDAGHPTDAFEDVQIQVFYAFLIFSTAVVNNYYFEFLKMLLK